MGIGRQQAKTEVLPGTLKMLILKCLTSGPMHGYGISQKIQVASRDVLHVGEGSLYPALQRMQLNRWIKAEWGQSENNRRARYYKLTAAGRKQLGIEEAIYSNILQAIAHVMEEA